MANLLTGLLGRIVSSHDNQDRSSSVGFANRRGASSRRLWRAAGQGKQLPRVKGGTITRQRLRARAFAQAFAEISAKYPGEPRKARRNMARAIAKREWRPAAAAAGGRP